MTAFIKSLQTEGLRDEFILEAARCFNMSGSDQFVKNAGYCAQKVCTFYHIKFPLQIRTTAKTDDAEEYNTGKGIEG